MRREISLPEFQAQQARMDRQEMLRLGDIPEEFWGPCDWARFDILTNRKWLNVMGPIGLPDVSVSAKSILIYGPVGAGKTKLSVEISIAMAERENCTRLAESTSPLYLLASRYAKAPWSVEIAGKVLIIDDYMRWYDPSSSGGQAVNALIADRYHRGWPTIITSNIKSPKDILDMAVLDRIGTGLIVEIRGQSKRREHAQGQ